MTDWTQTSARLKGRAWLVVRHDDAPRLLESAKRLGEPDDWLVRPVKKDTDPDTWVSITFPRALIDALGRALRASGVQGG
ncbi:hypothetical protein [Actinomadura sp. CNU-125]|uniref:hypothetical protein n=1 Tax=Actinomadura sp. CNU-125 TaxID=1904961 RepID=UPI00117882F2|nr:hypothetical protein [Actinomadura sp. CNU-125]